MTLGFKEFYGYNPFFFVKLTTKLITNFDFQALTSLYMSLCLILTKFRRILMVLGFSEGIKWIAWNVGSKNGKNKKKSSKNS